jgi:hypothetical protein
MIYERQLKELNKVLKDSLDTDTLKAEINQLKIMIEEEEAKMKRYRVND